MKGVNIVFDDGDKLFIICESNDVAHLMKKIEKCINKKKAITIDKFVTISTDKIRFISYADEVNEVTCNNNTEENKVFEEY